MSSPLEPPTLDAVALLAVLERHQVQYVVIGGYAAELHGSLRRTVDVDVVPRTTRDNLERLTAALRELHARIRTDDEPRGLPFATSADALAGMQMLNLITDHGELDLNFTPTGTTGYDDLHSDAVVFPIGRVEVQVASLADVIRSKIAAGRPKDFAALPELHQLAAGKPSAGGAEASTTRSARELARDGYPEPVKPISKQDLALARIQAARAQAAASRAARAPQDPPAQR